ncbi:hypothetical protein F0562_012483 [Nyssa sinensis]|uniref:Uncharacterized protein n=1 Tax=Nyssa sinensis TaxID=561372 RepID=A0A5J4ZTX2_9ASTE|nr:hypothetical protein F0562_012483 [Nyssa sinensis]
MDSKPTLGAKEEALNSHFSNGFVEPGNCESVGITNVEVDGLSSSDDALCWHRVVMDSKPTLGAKEEALNSHFSNGFVEPGNCESVGITNVEVDGLSSSDDAVS